jgi:succinoglycan biosynthesis transport protein ExoP
MDISFSQLLSIIRKKSAVILLFTLFCGICALIVSKILLPKTYVSTVKLYVSVSDSSTKKSDADLNDLNYAQKVVDTYVEMLQTNSFLKKVQDKASVDMDFDDFKKTVAFSALNNTEVFKADVRSHDAQTAKNIADAISELAPTTISEFQNNAALKIVDPAVLPDKPSFPNTALFTAIALILGLLVSSLYFVLRECLDIRIKCEEDITERYNIPVLASIPAFDKEFAKAKKRNQVKDRKS